MEPHIHWKINFGNCSFWWDNWLGVGLLAYFRDVSSRLDNSKVFAFLQNDQQDVDMILNMAHPQHVASILAIPLQMQQEVPDKAYQDLNANGEFSISTTLKSIRVQRTKINNNKYTQHKNIPFKCSFLM